MNRIYKSLINVTLAITVLLVCVACEDLLDVKPEQTLEEDEMYRNRFDADAAVLGIYGQFLGLAKQYVVLNELRADLMDVTGNADKNLQELNLHNVSVGNPYADPRPFYKVILSCNDALKNFDIMLENSKMSQADYDQRYSDIGTLRSWLYLQLAIHFGEVPYITEPFMTIDQLKNSGAKRLTLEQMISTLTGFVNSLPYKNEYSTDNSLYMTIDGYSTRSFFINKKFLLGDLFLWKGKYDSAAFNYKDVMMTPVPSVDFFDSYRVKYSSPTDNNDISVGYIRYKEMDYYSLVDNAEKGWRSMFIRPQDKLFNSEWIWVLPFESRFKQETPFVDLFSRVGGSYLVKPSQSAIDLWNSQQQRNGFPWDQRGRFTYFMSGGAPVIGKYIYNYDPLNPLVKNGKWFLARAALLHLRFAEAANRDNLPKLALAFLNPGGIGTAYDDPAITDVSLDRQTFLPAPYDFQARNSNVPYFRDTWHRHDGIRGRAYVTPSFLSAADTAAYFVNTGTGYEVSDPEGLKVVVEDKLIKEAALELAYEGNRWPDLLRIALRRYNTGDTNYLADKIGDKLEAAGYPEAAAVRAKLQDRANWFLPFSLE